MTEYFERIESVRKGMIQNYTHTHRIKSILLEQVISILFDKNYY